MVPIGFTTGSIYKSYTINEAIKFYASLGANAIELSFAHPRDLENFWLTIGMIDGIKKFKHMSIHAPWQNVRYRPKISDNIIKKLDYIISRIPIKGIVIHPDVVDDFNYLEQSGLPFWLENMGSNKKSYTSPPHFESLRDEYKKFGFVLDVQHAYEHDPTMELAKELKRIMGDRLRQIHVSGSPPPMFPGRHYPVHIADNKDAIFKMLKGNIDVPIILEGYLNGYNLEKARKELILVRNATVNQNI